MLCKTGKGEGRSDREIKRGRKGGKRRKRETGETKERLIIISIMSELIYNYREDHIYMEPKKTPNRK